MEKIIIPRSELEELFISLEMQPGDINILWSRHIKTSKPLRRSPDMSSYLIYNALRGKDILCGMSGKHMEQHLFNKLSGANAHFKHPWQEHYYTVMYMVGQLQGMTKTHKVGQTSSYQYTSLSNNMRQWLSMYARTCEYNSMTSKRHTTWGSLLDRLDIPINLAKFLIPYMENTAVAIRRTITNDRCK